MNAKFTVRRKYFRVAVSCLAFFALMLVASVIGMYFAPATKAPITLLELGLSARSGKLVVCCPDGFWRKGNVEAVCTRYGVQLLGELTEFVGVLRERVSGLGRGCT